MNTAQSTSTEVPNADLSLRTAPPEGESTVKVPAAEQSGPRRLVSLDALRGFTMFWILGGAAFENAFHALPPNRFTSWVNDQLSHCSWEGCHFEDIIFPMFVFVVGVSLVLTLPAKVERDGRSKTFWRVARRAAVLFLLGVFYNGGGMRGVEGVRWMGVLQRIAIAYFFASYLFLWMKPRNLIFVIVGILLGYWALLAWVPVPGFGAGDYAEGHNLTNYLDHMYLPGRMYDKTHDPEGLLSSFPAVATCLFGVLAGVWLVREGRAGRKALQFVGMGLLLIKLGLFWGGNYTDSYGAIGYFPIIKKIWTSSYVVLVAGWSALFLGVFYLVIDVWKLRHWAVPFVWIGMNPITLYLFESIASSRNIALRIVGGTIYDVFNFLVMPGTGDLLVAIVASTISVWLAWFLHNRRIFLRV